MSEQQPTNILIFIRLVAREGRGARNRTVKITHPPPVNVVKLLGVPGHLHQAVSGHTALTEGIHVRTLDFDPGLP